MEAIKLCRLDTPIIFIEARINLSRFVVTRSEERFSRNAETDLVCRLLLEKKKKKRKTLRAPNPKLGIAPTTLKRHARGRRCGTTRPRALGTRAATPTS